MTSGNIKLRFTTIRRGIELEIVEIYTRERVCIPDSLRMFNAESVIYAYHDDGYSGYGFAFIKINKKFYFHDMGHCSCYGAFEEFNKNDPCKSLKAMFKVWKKSNFYTIDITEINEILDIISEQWECELN